MQPQLSVALNRLDMSRRELRAVVDSVPSSFRARKPAPDRWSVNEVVEHISLVEQFFLKTLLANLETARTAGLTPEVGQPEMLSDQMKTVLEDRTNKRVAPEQVQPKGTVDAAESLQTIDAGHAQLTEALRSADGLALSTVTHEHRFFGKLNAYQWVELIAGHEARHIAQLREIAAQVSPV